MANRPLAPPVPAAPSGRRPLLAPRARSLRLYPGRPGELWVYWRLPADLWVPYRAAFLNADGSSALVVRLLRLGADGQAQTLAERLLRPQGLGGEGEVSFGVGEERGPFQAELGLINPQGGWLALVRSNRLEQVGTVGLEQLRPPPAGLDDDLAEQAPGHPLSQVDAGCQAAAVGAPACEVAAQSLRVGGGLPEIGYGSIAPAAYSLVIEAELRISGWGPPCVEIDLFGHPYRIGPGGRFQLSLRIDDPELIRQVLARHPPPRGWS